MDESACQVRSPVSVQRSVVPLEEHQMHLIEAKIIACGMLDCAEEAALVTYGTALNGPEDEEVLIKSVATAIQNDDLLQIVQNYSPSCSARSVRPTNNPPLCTPGC